MLTQAVPWMGRACVAVGPSKRSRDLRASGEVNHVWMATEEITAERSPSEEWSGEADMYVAM